MAEATPDFSPLHGQKHIAVALSGGADSTALTHMLCVWAELNEATLHALIVDHGLRPESADEAQSTLKQAQNWPHCHPVILTWQGDKPESGLMQAARQARYGLMSDYCARHGIRILATGHHGDDQVETFFIRLSKGSGPDGLAGIRPLTALDDHLTLYRPLLDKTHQDLVDYCKDHHLSWIEDAGNHNMDYERNRLRRFLADEGLETPRIQTLMRRLHRVKDTLDALTADVAQQARIDTDSSHHIYDWSIASHYGEEILLRLMIQAIKQLTGQSRRDIRLAKLENLCRRMLEQQALKTTSLHHCLIQLQKGRLDIRLEA